LNYIPYSSIQIGFGKSIYIYRLLTFD